MKIGNCMDLMQYDGNGHRDRPIFNKMLNVILVDFIAGCLRYKGLLY